MSAAAAAGTPALAAGGRVHGALLATATVVAGLGVARVAGPLAPVVVLSLPFAWLLVARPVLRRLALRNALRRPRETALVIIGSMLGTAIITGSFVVGDTLDASIVRNAHTRLGPVDELVAAASPAELPDLERRLRAAGPAVDGVLPLTTAAVTVAAGGRAEPRALLVELDFVRARAFGGDPAATGFEGPTPPVGEAALGADLARTLDAAAGATVEVFAYGRRQPLRVARVLPRLGVAGLAPADALFGGGSRAPTLLVPPGTLARLGVAGPAAAGPGAAPPTSFVAVSNAGGVLAGAAATPAGVEAIRRAVGPSASILTPKRTVVDAAEEQGQQFTQLFTSIGFFSVLAGVLLLVNIFVALAQERKVSLGMLRAVGLRRSSLVGSFSLEGWCYAIGAALLGALVGVGVGRAIIFVAAGIFEQGSDEFSLDLRFTFEGSSLVTGFTIGFAIALATVVLSSLVIARLNVIRAIRDLPEPPRTRQQRLVGRLGGGGLVLAGLATTAAGISGEAPAPALAGPTIAVAGLALALAGVVPGRPLRTAAALASIGWSASCFSILPRIFREVEITLFALQGILLVAAGVAAAITNLDTIGRGLRTVGGGASAMSLRLGLAYPLARRFRTGAILAMYAMVVFVLTFILVLSNLFGSQADRFERDTSGGFDLRLASNASNPVPVADVRATPGVVAVAPLSEATAEFEVPGYSEGFEPFPVTGVTPALLERGAPGLARWDRSRFGDDERAAWRAAVADPKAIVINEFFLQDGNGPPQATPPLGTEVRARDRQTGRTTSLRVAAVADAGFGSFSAYVGQPALQDLLGARAVPNLLHVAVAEGTDAAELATALNRRHLANGADARTFRSIVEENLASQLSFFRLMQGYIALGLLVGIAGLGVVMVRAVRERRREVGVLRSLGFTSAQVRRAFLAEAGFIAALGVVLGVALALVCAWRTVGSEAFGEGIPFDVPWLALALVIGLTLAFSLLATAAPAQQASGIRPAVALRTTD